MAILLFLFLSLPVRCLSQDFIYKWRQVEGPAQTTIVNPDSASTVVTGLYVPGEYLFEFCVSNMFGSACDTCKVTVLPPNVLALDTSQKIVIRRPEVKRFEAKTIVQGDKILVQVKSPTKQIIKIHLLDMSGRILAEANVPVQKGETIFSLPKPRQRGIYIIRIYNERSLEVLKTII